MSAGLSSVNAGFRPAEHDITDVTHTVEQVPLFQWKTVPTPKGEQEKVEPIPSVNQRVLLRRKEVSDSSLSCLPEGSGSGNLSTSSSCSETYASFSDIKP